jgi:hypothetical protein
LCFIKHLVLRLDMQLWCTLFHLTFATGVRVPCPPGFILKHLIFHYPPDNICQGLLDLNWRVLRYSCNCSLVGESGLAISCMGHFYARM